MSLIGKKAVVTGSEGGLGGVVTQRFLAEGMKVVGSSRKQQERTGSSPTAGPGLTLVRTDVTNESDVRNLFDTALRIMGGVDIVVNTVGGFLPRKPVPELTVEEWDLMMRINLISAFLCTREALRRMLGQSYGRIINMSAMTGLIPSPGRAPYAISKAGVSMLTDIAAQEQKGTGITINAIAPSIIDTPTNRQSMPDEDFRRWVKPENIADTVCYLCSDAAGDVTGTTIKVFGGL
ncbi:MAG TPA: SDR family NAD(P)-dependent oxidoreductase [Bacteroidota bacterium]|nr:SDR family NAD(P)-dependent oxidoreductase [Bacteroidota bacterium]